MASGAGRRYACSMKTLLGGALAASVLALAAPATAQTTSNPIALQRVDTAPIVRVDSVPATVRLAFENTAATAAREVTFRITDGSGRQVEVDDVGTFSNGVTVRHDFRVAALGDGISVRVVRVKLADGSGWVDSSPQPQPRRQAVGASADDGEHGVTL